MGYEIIYQYYDIVILANDEKIIGINLITMKTHKIHHALYGFDLEDFKYMFKVLCDNCDDILNDILEDFEKSQCYEDIKNMEE